MLGPMLARAFPGDEVDDLDVLELVRTKPVDYVRAAISGAVHQARPLVSRRTDVKRAIVTSPGYQAAVRRIVESRVSPATHRFSLQSQSIFSSAIDGVPHFVYTDHAHLANLAYPAFDRRRLASRRYLSMEADLYRSARTVFVRSNNVRDVIVHGYGCPEDRVAVIGVGPNVDPDTFGEHVGWHDGRIIFIGVDWERKGGPQLVEVFRKLRRERPSVRLDIVGCSPPGVAGDGIEVHGRRSLAEVADLMAGADIFCLPTLAEPFGVAFIEAMHAGLPIVGTRLGAIPDFVLPGETGLLVEPLDVDDLHRALHDLVSDPDAAMRMGTQARSLARERYDWGVVMTTMHDHIEQCVAP